MSMCVYAMVLHRSSLASWLKESDDIWSKNRKGVCSLQILENEIGILWLTPDPYSLQGCGMWDYNQQIITMQFNYCTHEQSFNLCGHDVAHSSPIAGVHLPQHRPLYKDVKAKAKKLLQTKHCHRHWKVKYFKCLCNFHGHGQTCETPGPSVVIWPLNVNTM